MSEVKLSDAKRDVAAIQEFAASFVGPPLDALAMASLAAGFRGTNEFKGYCQAEVTRRMAVIRVAAAQGWTEMPVSLIVKYYEGTKDEDRMMDQAIRKAADEEMVRLGFKFKSGPLEGVWSWDVTPVSD